MNDRFAETEVNDLPVAVQRYFRAAVAPGTPLVTSIAITMRGHIRIGRWLPFTATELLDPHNGFEWRARVGRRLIVGSDHYARGRAEMHWKLLGLIPIVHADGRDVARSSAGRCGAESLWVPPALLPRVGVVWESDDESSITARFDVDDTPVVLRHRLDEHAHVASIEFDRWGNPDRTGTWGWHPFGGDVHAHRTFGGLTIPSRGAFGWHYGTDRWADGEFFRYEITDLRPGDVLTGASSHRYGRAIAARRTPRLKGVPVSRNV
jgi:hypothetical protein